MKLPQLPILSLSLFFNTLGFVLAIPQPHANAQAQAHSESENLHKRSQTPKRFTWPWSSGALPEEEGPVPGYGFSSPPDHTLSFNPGGLEIPAPTALSISVSTVTDAPITSTRHPISALPASFSANLSAVAASGTAIASICATNSIYYVTVTEELTTTIWVDESYNTTFTTGPGVPGTSSSLSTSTSGFFNTTTKSVSISGNVTETSRVGRPQSTSRSASVRSWTLSGFVNSTASSFVGTGTGIGTAVSTSSSSSTLVVYSNSSTILGTGTLVQASSTSSVPVLIYGVGVNSTTTTTTTGIPTSTPIPALSSNSNATFLTTNTTTSRVGRPQSTSSERAISSVVIFENFTSTGAGSTIALIGTPSSISSSSLFTATNITTTIVGTPISTSSSISISISLSTISSSTVAGNTTGVGGSIVGTPISTSSSIAVSSSTVLGDSTGGDIVGTPRSSSLVGFTSSLSLSSTVVGSSSIPSSLFSSSLIYSTSTSLPTISLSTSTPNATSTPTPTPLLTGTTNLHPLSTPLLTTTITASSISISFPSPSLSPSLSSATTLGVPATTTTTKPPILPAFSPPNPHSALCGIHGLPVGDFFLAEFVEDAPGVDVSLEGCFGFCSGIFGRTHNCRSYAFYPEPGTGAPRCDLYGGSVAQSLHNVVPSAAMEWWDLGCGDPVVGL